MTLTQRHIDVDATSLHRISVNTTSFKGYVPAWIEQVLYYLTLLCRIDVGTTSLRHVLAWMEQVLQYSTLLRRIDVGTTSLQRHVPAGIEQILQYLFNLPPSHQPPPNRRVHG